MFKIDAMQEAAVLLEPCLFPPALSEPHPEIVFCYSRLRLTFPFPPGLFQASFPSASGKGDHSLTRQRLALPAHSP